MKSWLTLYNHLVTRYQYLLAVRGLSILEDCRALLASGRVGHGNLKFLNAIGSGIRQLDGSIRSNGNWNNRKTFAIKIRILRSRADVLCSRGTFHTILPGGGLIDGGGYGDARHSRGRAVLPLAVRDALR